MLASKAKLSTASNAIVVNLCQNGNDIAQWSKFKMDHEVFNASQSVSVLAVGVPRKLLVSDRRGKVRGAIIMFNGSLLHLCRRFLQRFRVRVEYDASVKDRTIFLTFHRCTDPDKWSQKAV